MKLPLSSALLSLLCVAALPAAAMTLKSMTSRKAS